MTAAPLGRRPHPVGHARPGLALVEPPRPVALDADTLVRLARLYGTSWVTPWSERGRANPDQRICELVELSDDFEVWAIHWPPGSRLQLHDHGGASGALWIVDGSLTEVTPGAGVPRRRSLTRGNGVGFGPQHLHEVSNPAPAVASSVHVYAPPMAHMTFFRSDATGVVPERTDVRESAAWAT